MKITYLDADTREVIKVADYLTPELTSTSAKQRAEKFANILSAEIVKIFPLPDESEWTVELKIPLDIRRMYTPSLATGYSFSPEPAFISMILLVSISSPA